MIEFHRLDLVDQGLQSWEGLSERANSNFLLINVQRNQLETFEFFGTHPYLTELQAQHNRIRSFRGLTRQASLKSLHLRGCPIAYHPYYRIMALLTIGLSIEVIDGLPVTLQERDIARSLGKRAALSVSYGWLLDMNPRVTKQYDAIIDELKRLRKDEHRHAKDATLVTVNVALHQLQHSKRMRGHDEDAERQLRDKEKVITRLARRVAQLEQQCAAPPADSLVVCSPPGEQGHLAENLPGPSSAEGLFSAAELDLMDTVTFTRGIRLRHNLSAVQGSLERVHVELDHATLTASKFLSRERVLQLPLSSLQVRHMRPLTLIVTDDMGGTLELLFDTLPLLHAVYKAIFLLSSRAIPPLSALTQSELQRIERERQDRLDRQAPMSSLLIHNTRSKPPLLLAPQTSGEATASPPPMQPQLSLHEERGTPMTSDLEYDNVSDVPPLPPARPCFNTSVRTDSIQFAEESGSEPHSDKGASHTNVSPVATEGERAGASDPSHTAEKSSGNLEAKGAAGGSRRFAHLLVDRSSSDSHASLHDQEAVERTAAGANASLVNNEAHHSRKSPAMPSPALSSSIQFDTPSPSVCAPPSIPPRVLQSETGTVASAVPSVVGNTRNGVAPPRHLPHRLGSAGTPNAWSRSSSLRNGKGPREANATHVRTSTFDRENNAASGEAGAASAQPVRPAVPSRFAALRIASDSDSDPG